MVLLKELLNSCLWFKAWVLYFCQELFIDRALLLFQHHESISEYLLLLHALWTSLLRMFSLAISCFFWPVYWSTNIFIVFCNDDKNLSEMCRLEGQAQFLFQSFTAKFYIPYQHQYRYKLASEKYKNTCSLQNLWYKV